MSDPAATPSTPAATFAAFEAAENAREMGQEPPAPATPAEPVEEADDDEPEGADAPAAAEPTPEKPVTAAPQPTPEKPVSKRQQHINELARKAAEAEQRSAKLEAKLAEVEARLSKPVEPIAAKPEPVKAEPIIDPKDPEPVEANFDDWGKYLRAVAEWDRRQERRAEAAAKAARDSEQSFAQKRDSWIDRREAFRATDPTFDTHAMPFLARVPPNTPLYDVLMDSPVGPQLALHLATHPEDVTRIGALHPIQQLRELGKLEAKFDTPETTSASASAGPAAKTVTTAPTPPTTLAARSAEPVDRVGAAVARGDFLAFAAEEDRKALAASR